jgi:hypothetical protein
MNLNLRILLLVAIPSTSLACSYWYGTNNVRLPLLLLILHQDLTTILDLNLPVPFMYVETFSSPAPDCATDPATVTEWRTAWIGTNTATSYLALATSYTLQVQTTTSYCTYIYPELYLTMLKPGDVIKQVSGNTRAVRNHPRVS